MNAIKRFFQEDIPAVFSAGKWRVSLMKLNSSLSQLEKQKNAALNELGKKAWESRVKDEHYLEVYGELEELNATLSQIQQEIDAKQNAINQETDHLNATKLDFDNRLKSTENQRQSAAQKLAGLQANQKNIEVRISQLQTTTNQLEQNIQNMQAQVNQLEGSSQPDKDEKIASLQSTIATTQAQINDTEPQMEVVKAELQTNRAEQAPVKNEVDGYNQLIRMLQEQSRSALTAIQEKLKNLQQDLLRENEKKNKIVNQMDGLMPNLGNQVYRYRPASDALSPAYTKVDAVNGDIKGVNDQINLTQARLSSVNKASIQKVALTGGALVFLLICVAAFVAFVIPTISSALKPDPRRDVRLVQSWTIENCSVSGSGNDYVDISIWENRRNNALAVVDLDSRLLGSNDIVLDSEIFSLDISPNGLAVVMQGLDSNGSRVEDVVSSVNSVFYIDTVIPQISNVDVATFFERTLDSNNITLSLEITNRSNFGLELVTSGTADASVLVLNAQDELIDILIRNTFDDEIPVDSLSKITFQSLSPYGLASCLQSEYSQEPITFWYFVPLKISTGSDDQFTVSGKVDYVP